MSDSEKSFIVDRLREILAHAVMDKDLMTYALHGKEEDAEIRYARAYGRASACLDLIRIHAESALRFLETAGEEARP